MEESSISFVGRLIIATYLTWAGLLLVLAPWSGYWEFNYFASHVPWLGAVMANPYARGAVTGVGLVTTVAGMRDVASAVLARHDRSPAAPRDGSA